MLTFLRKIRKSLIESGSARKYLIYAIGEIALVVIGILIALQVNNWNEARKTKSTEIKLLNGFVKEMRENQKILDEAIEIHSQSLNNIVDITDKWNELDN